jgi:DNA polymerase beta
MDPKTDKKADIINALELMRKKEIANKQPFKARAYATVIKNIKEMTDPIYTIDDLANVQGIGDSIKKKIVEILETGHLKQADEYSNKPEMKVFDDLLKIHGIGPAKARQLIDSGINSIDDLKSAVEKDPGVLNEKQKMGLKYWEEFILRIPRQEMDKHDIYVKDIIKQVDSKYIVELTGSYRRGDKDSGDIDILITHPDDSIDHESNFKMIIEKLVALGYIKDIFAKGPKKCLAVCKLKRHRHFRRIDFMMTHKHEFPFALLYFTGSGPFNVAMRNLAIEKGYSLSEYGFKYLKGPKEGEFVKSNFEKEEDIFYFLEVKYIEPKNRVATVVFESTKAP